MTNTHKYIGVHIDPNEPSKLMCGASQPQIHFALAHDLLEANGKTVKENNLAKEHQIPLGSLVEINLDYDSSHGVRAFVVQHQRDCDGTPLYGLAIDPGLIDDLEYYGKSTDDTDQGIFETLIQKVNGGWSDDSLIVIRKSED